MKALLKGILAIALLAAGVLSAAAQSNSITIQVNTPGAAISSNLFGIFFEEINFAGDGGLYAEMVRNRSFANSTNASFWTLVTNGTATGAMNVDFAKPLNSNNVASLRLTKLTGTGGIGAANSGYFGMSVVNGASYNLSLYAAGSNGFAGPVIVQLQNSSGSTTYAQTSFNGLTAGFQHFTATLTSTGTDASARLVVSLTNVAAAWVDEVSLFPQATFQGRTNGLRTSLANMLVALTPSFFRYPGGNFIESNTITNAVRWKKTIGDPALRPGHQNDSWGYWSTDGFGLHEYLLFCEDLGMEPLYGINCGLMLGYNGGANNTVPIDQMGPWVQDALDLIEYVNGATNTFWGGQRAANGHPAPFNMKYLEIGNENGGPLYDARYTLFYDAMKSNYPNIKLISPVWGSPSSPVSRPVEIRDEHYYTSPATFRSYATKYDSYDRNGPKVFVGEYAVTSGYGTNGNLSAALGEAAFMTGMERNADIVELASYAPLFANMGGIQWHPDLIYYDDSRVFGTPAYYVQQLFSNHRGNYVLPPAVTAVTANTIFVCSSLVTTSNQVVVKVVNSSSSAQSTTINVRGVSSVASNATVAVLTSPNLTDENTLASPTTVFPVTNTINNAGASFVVMLPANSLSVYTLSFAGTFAIANLQLQVGSPLHVGQEMQSTLFAQESGTSNLINLAGNYAVTYGSLNTNIAAVTSSGLIIGVGPGTAGIFASYGSLSVTQSVQVVPAGPTVLIHRYSFNDGTANDSIGTANGTFFNVSGLASISGGKLNLVGSNGDYVDLGTGLITTTNISNGAVTLEAWASFNVTNGSWARLFDFGNMAGGSGGTYIFLTANNAANGGSARLAVSDSLPGGNEAGITFGYNLLGKTNIHLVAVFNPSPTRQFLGLYTNGVLSASTSTAGRHISSINDVFSFLGRSLWSADAWLRGSIDEFRVYNGELDKYQIAASLQAGPNQTNFDVGTLVGFAVDPGPMPVALNSVRQVAAYLNFTLASNISVIGDSNLTFSSDNTNVFTISPSGILSAAAVGSANLTTTFIFVSGNVSNMFTNVVPITVSRGLPAILTHRYNFNNNTLDQVGGADGVLQGGATVNSSNLVLSGSSNYLALPANLVTNYTAITIETWVTDNGSGSWARIFDFGNNTLDYMFLTLPAGGGNLRGAYTTSGTGGEQILQWVGGRPSAGQPAHIVWTTDAATHTGRLYVNGVQVGINTTMTMSPADLGPTVNNWLGRSQFSGDAYFNGSIDEFRIYSGAEYADEIAAAYALGPNTLLSVARPTITSVVSGSNLTLSWPLASAGFTLQSRTNADAGVWGSVFPLPQIVGSQWQVTVPMVGNAMYFRLLR